MLVTTVRATKSHGGMAFERPRRPRTSTRCGAGSTTSPRTSASCASTACRAWSSINNFPTDTDAEIELVGELAADAGAETVVVNRGFADGGDGAVDLANAVVEACERPNDVPPAHPRRARRSRDQIEAIATQLYGADGVDYLPQARARTSRGWTQLGFGTVPVCMAKTHLSLSATTRCC